MIISNTRIKIILITLFFALIILQYRFWCADDGLFKMLYLKRSITEVQAKNDVVVRRNINLSDEIAALKRGGAAIENRARTDLGMVKKGEIFYQVIR